MVKRLRALRPRERAACTKLLDKGAVLIKWPEDKERDDPEPEQRIWSVLKPEDFSKQRHLSWRFYAKASLRRLRDGEVPTPAQTTPTAAGEAGTSGSPQTPPTAARDKRRKW